MKLDVNGQSYSVGSQGQTDLNTVLGALGTASFLGMGGNNGCGNGILGGLFGGNNCGNNGCVSQQELGYAVALAACQGREYASATARQEDSLVFNEARRTDDKIANVLKQTNEGLIAVGNGVSRLDVKTACLEEKLNWIREESARNLAEAKAYTDHRVDCEAKERQAADQNILAYTNGELAKKISGTLKLDGNMVSYSACRPVLQACPCGSEQNPYFINSSTADVTAITQAVLNAIKAAQTPAQ